MGQYHARRTYLGGIEKILPCCSRCNKSYQQVEQTTWCLLWQRKHCRHHQLITCQCRNRHHHKHTTTLIGDATTTNHETLGALVASTKRLATMNTQKHSTIKSLRDEINALQHGSNTCKSGGRAYASGHTLSVAQEKQVIQALKRGWYILFFSQPMALE